MKQLEVLYFYTPLEVRRSTVRVKCFAQEHNTMTARTARSGDERTNYEAGEDSVEGLSRQISHLVTVY